MQGVPPGLVLTVPVSSCLRSGTPRTNRPGLFQPVLSKLDLRTVRVKLQVSPYVTPMSCSLAALAKFVRLSESRMRRLGRYCNAGNPDPLQPDDKVELRAVAHLGIRGGGWTDSKKS